MASSNAVDRETPWCSACNEYAEYLEKTMSNPEGGRVTRFFCKDCNNEMWSATSCKRWVWGFKLVCPLAFGLAYFIWVGISGFARVAPFGGLVLMFFYYWHHVRKCSKHLQKFEEFAVRKSRNLYADRLGGFGNTWEGLVVRPNLSDLTWTTTDGQVTITNCDQGVAGELVIPDTIEGDTVTSIGDGAFFGCCSLTSITIPESVTSIGDHAFCGCGALTSITIPESVTRLRESTFSLCDSLTAVTFLGDAPQVIALFSGATPTIYRKPEAKGWGDTFAGRPVKLISEKP